MITPEQILEGKVLIVDDEPANIALLEQTLRQGGFTSTTSTTDPRKALELYKNIEPDLVLLDLNMPHMDGFQVMEQIKEVDSKSKIPIMILTAQIDHATRLRALDAGARDFLTKPFDILEVSLRIKNMLEISLLYSQTLNSNTSLDERYIQSQTELFSTKSKLKEEINRREK